MSAAKPQRTKPWVPSDSDGRLIRVRGDRLPHMKFHQVSWAPEIRLVLRSDGHYPPLHASEFRGIEPSG